MMLSDAQMKLLMLLDARESAQQPVPTYRQIRDALGYTSTGPIHRLVVKLEERGYIRRMPGRRQAIELVRSRVIEKCPACGHVLHEGR